MRAYTLAVLRDLTKSDKPMTDGDIINWANNKLSSFGKSTSVTSFKDPSISDGKAVIDLIDCIVPGSIKYDLVKTCESDEVCVKGFHFSTGLFNFCTGDGICPEMKNVENVDTLVVFHFKLQSQLLWMTRARLRWVNEYAWLLMINKSHF